MARRPGLSRPPRGLAGAGLVALWALSLALPVARIGPSDVWWGWQVLVFGWLAILFFQFGWLANFVFAPLVLAASLSDRPPRWLLVPGAVLLALFTLDALLWREVTYDNGPHPIAAFGAGYYLWIAAMLGCQAWAVLLLRRGRV